ncbi:MAG: flagellar biosynthetic protein FliR [Thermoguttaceae bacterium]|nr:flagellar biosynthetic protein FliR [Thermoguttaceae bacterium]
MGPAPALGSPSLWLALLVFARSAGLLWLMPVIGGRRVPRSVRLAEAVVLAVAVFPSLWYLNLAPPDPPVEKMFFLVSEYLIGLAVGATVAVFFTAVSVCGALISRVGGFSAAATLDPESDDENGALETLLSLAALAVFLAAGGLEKFLTAAISLYESVPPGTLFAPESALSTLTSLLSQAAALGAATALPVLAALGALWLGSALLNRVAPHLHFLTMTLTFSGNLLATLFVLHLALGGILLLIAARLPDWNALLPSLFSTL